MAQYRRWNWEDDDSTFDMNWRDLLFFPPGLYTGFDAKNLGSSGTLAFVLWHNATGVRKVDESLSSTPKNGLWRTKQGVCVYEDDVIPLTLGANLSSFPRIDLVVGTHQYLETPGGAVATYQIIQGTPGATPVAPALTFPNQQVILGTFYVPAGTTDLAAVGLTYTRSLTPAFAGDPSIVYTNRVQEITATKQLDHVTVNPLTLAYTTDTLTATADSNVYLIPNVGGDYLNVNTVTLPFNTTGRGNKILAVTLQRIKLNFSGGNLASFTGAGVAYIEAGETFELLDLFGTIGFEYLTTSLFLVLKGGEAPRGLQAKFMSMVMHNISNTAVADAGNTIFQYRDANILVVTLDFAALNATGGLKGINSNDLYWDGTNLFTKGGGRYILNFIDSGASGKPLTITIGASVPSSHKPFGSAGNAGTLYVDTGGFVECFESAFNYAIIAIYDTHTAVWRTRFEDRILANTYPGLVMGTHWTLPNIWFRKNGQGEVIVEGVASITGTTGASQLIFILPAGYRPFQRVQVPCTLLTGTVYSIVPIEIETTGEIYFTNGSDVPALLGSGISLDPIRFFTP